MERFQCLFDGSGRIEAMNLVKIDVIGFQPPQTVLNSMKNVFPGKAALIGIIPHRIEYLRGNDQAIPRQAKLLEGTPKNLFTPAEKINIGSVEKVNAAFNGLPNEGTTLLLVEHPLALSVHRPPPFKLS